MTMLAEHIDEAVKKLCPHGKQTCCMALLGGCWVIDKWRQDHTAPGLSPEFVPIEGSAERLKEAGRKGGIATVMNRGTYGKD